MELSERIKALRQKHGLSQEKLAEQVGVSRQAVAKWEAGQSAPSTDNLFRLAEVLDTTVDLLLQKEPTSEDSPARQIYQLMKEEMAQEAAKKAARRKNNLRSAVGFLFGYLLLYLLGRILWVDFSDSSFLGWLFLARPKGEHSYLYGWLLSSHLFYYAAALSVLPSIWGRWRFSLATLSGFSVGLVLGIFFGPYPAGTIYGTTPDYGWAIWGCTFLIFAAAGILWEIIEKRRKK